MKLIFLLRNTSSTLPLHKKYISSSSAAATTSTSAAAADGGGAMEELLPRITESKEADHIANLLLHNHDPKQPLSSVAHHLHRYTLTLPLLHQTLLRLHGCSKLALSLFTFSKSFPHLHPSPSSYAILLDSMGKAHQFDLSWQLLLELPNPHPSLFPPLLRRLIAAGLTRQALRAFDDLPSLTDSPPSPLLFSFLLDTLCKYNHAPLATRLFNTRTRPSSSSSSFFPPTTKLYTLLIYGWCKIKRLDMANRLFSEMEERGFPPNNVTYNVLLDGICRRASLHPDYRFFSILNRAHHVLDEMSGKNIEPDVVTYSIVLHLYSRAHKAGLCLEKLEEMKRKGVSPSVATYTSVIKCLCSCGRMGDAEVVLMEMERSGVKASGETYNCFFKEYKGRRDGDGAIKMYREVRGREGLCTKSCNLLMVMFESMGDWEMVEEIWGDMRAGGSWPDSDSYTLIVHGLCRRGWFRPACEMLLEMVERGFLPQKRTFQTLFKWLVGTGGSMAWGMLKKRLDQENKVFTEAFDKYHIKPYRR